MRWKCQTPQTTRRPRWEGPTHQRQPCHLQQDFHQGSNRTTKTPTSKEAPKGNQIFSSHAQRDPFQREFQPKSNLLIFTYYLVGISISNSPKNYQDQCRTLCPSGPPTPRFSNPGTSSQQYSYNTQQPWNPQLLVALCPEPRPNQTMFKCFYNTQ